MKYLLLATAGLALAACAGKSTSPENTTYIAPQENRYPSGVDTTPDVLRENGPSTTLENCGGRNGSAVLKRKGDGYLYLVVTGLECGSWATSRNDFGRDEKDKEKAGPYPLSRQPDNSFGGEIKIDESESGVRTIILGSISYFKKMNAGKSTARQRWRCSQVSYPTKSSSFGFKI